MVSLREAVSSSVQNFLCSAATDADPFRNWVENATSTIPGVGPATRAADGVGDAVGALVCPANPQPIAQPPVYPPPAPTITGCNAVPYRTRVTYTRTLAGNVQTEVFFDNNSYTGPVVQDIITPRPGSGTTLSFDLDVEFASGTFRVLTNPFTDQNTTAEVVSIEYVRTDGQPDNCPTDPDVPPQLPPTGGDNITYDGPTGPQIDVPITFAPDFPIVLPNGNINIPIIVGFPTFDFGIDFNVSTGDVVFNFGGNDSADNCCPPIDDIGDDDDPEDPEEPVETKRLWGIKVNCTINESMLEATQVSDGNGPTMYWPDIGQVRFAVEVAGKRAWSLPQKLNTISQFVAVNLPAVAYDWDILERPGVSYTVQEVVVTETEGDMIT